MPNLVTLLPTPLLNTTVVHTHQQWDHLCTKKWILTDCVKKSPLSSTLTYHTDLVKKQNLRQPNVFEKLSAILF
jgi:hypothetical protein